MQKKFIQNLLFLLILNLLIKPFWILGIDRAVQNSVGNQEYGFYWALFNFSFIFQILLDIGINSFNNRNIAQHRHLLSKYFSSIILLKLILTLFYLVIVFIVAFFIGYDHRAFMFLIFLALNQVLSSFILYLRSNISALQYFKTDSVFSILDRTIMIILCSVALWGNFIRGTFRIEWFVYIQTISLSITTILAFIFVYRKTHFFRLRFNYPFTLLVIKNSYPFAILALLMSLYTRIDGVMIERLIPGPEGEIQAGIYAQSYRILDAMNMIAFLFATLLLPIFSNMLKNKDNVTELAVTSFRMFLFPALLLVIICFVYSNQIIGLLYHHHDEYSARIFRCLIINYLSIGSVYIFGTLLTANANLKFLNYVSAVGMLVNIVLNFFLIKQFNAFGAVMATLATQLIVSALQVYKATRIFSIQLKMRTLINSLSYLIIIIGAAYIFNFIQLNWTTGIILLLGIGISLIFILRLIRFRVILGAVLPQK